MSEKNTNLENVFVNLPGLIESENYPSIIDDIGEDVFSIELQFDHHDRKKVEIILKRDMYEEHICAEADSSEGEIVLKCSNPDFPERFVKYIVDTGSLSEENIIEICRQAQSDSLFGKATDSGFFSHPSTYSED